LQVAPLNEKEAKVAGSSVRNLRVALSNFFLYAPDNAMVQQSLDRFLQDLNELLALRPQINLGETEGQLLVEGTPVDPKHTGSVLSIIELFHSHQLHSFTFLRGLSREELASLLQLLRPKAIAEGDTLQEALKRIDIPHIQVNQKVFVAVKEGEKLIASEDLGGEENVEEALQSLHAFLNIFSKVKPDGKKREILGVLQSQLEPLKGEGPGGSPGSGGVDSRGSGDGAGSAGWGDLLAGIMALKQTLQGVQVQVDPAKARESVDILLQKLILLMENQGAMDEKTKASLENRGEEQESLFDLNEAINEWHQNNFVSLLDPAQEENVAKALENLNNNPEPELLETIGKLLGAGIRGEDEDIACLALRHTTRIRRELYPREKQVEELRAIRSLVAESTPYETLKANAALLTSRWDAELKDIDWAEVATLLKQWKRLSETSQPAALPQATLARETLQSLLSPDFSRRLLDGAIADERAGEPAKMVLSMAGPEVAAQLLDRALKTSPSDPNWGRMMDLLYGLQSEGAEVLEKWLASHETGAQLDAFLRIVERVPMSATLAAAFEARWAFIPVPAKKKIFELAAKWECRAFRQLALMSLIEAPMDIARQALKALPRIHVEGDSLKVIEAVENRLYGHKDEKELFTLIVCKTLGEMEEPLSLTSLMEWTQSYSLLERRREKSFTIRMAAVEALGHFRSRQVEVFLERMVQREERDIKQVAMESLKQVREKLASTTTAQTAAENDPFFGESDLNVPFRSPSPPRPEESADDPNRGLLE